METISVFFSWKAAARSLDNLFLRRAAAYLIDFLPLLVLTQVVIFYTWGYSPLAPADQKITWRGECFAEARFARTTARYTAFLLWIGYSALFEASTYRASPGKQWLGLKVTTAQGKRPSFAQACTRNTLKLLSYLPFGLGFLHMAYDAQRQTWHDWLSDTFVAIEKK